MWAGGIFCCCECSILFGASDTYHRPPFPLTMCPQHSHPYAYWTWRARGAVKVCRRVMTRTEATSEAIDADLGLAALRQAASALERPWSRTAASEECGICLEPLFMPCVLQCGHVFDCACLLRVYARAPDTHAPCPSCRAPFTLDHAARWADMALQRMPPLSDERKREMQLALRELEEKQRTRLSAPPPPLRRRALDHLTSSPSCRRSWLSFCIGLACMLG